MEASCGAVLHQQIKNAEAPLPVFGMRVLQIAIDDLEGASATLSRRNVAADEPGSN
jgi:hypothetical protein